jgi:hypothetical protein
MVKPAFPFSSGSGQRVVTAFVRVYFYYKCRGCGLKVSAAWPGSTRRPRGVY